MGKKHSSNQPGPVYDTWLLHGSITLHIHIELQGMLLIENPFAVKQPIYLCHIQNLELIDRH